jgi:hypothetical protein
MAPRGDTSVLTTESTFILFYELSEVGRVAKVHVTPMDFFIAKARKNNRASATHKEAWYGLAMRPKMSARQSIVGFS